MLKSSASESTSGLRKGSCWCTNRIRYSMLFLSIQIGSYSVCDSSFEMFFKAFFFVNESQSFGIVSICTLANTESPENVQQGSLARFGRRQEVDF